MKPDDPWSRVDYRRLISWPERIAREWPFLAARLAQAPSRVVVDLGAGTGEHSRHLVANGYEVIGIDASAAMLAKAAEAPLPPMLRFTEGDITDVAALVDKPAGAAICLGNTLPHLDIEAMRRLARGLAVTLVRGGLFVFQILNYTRIREKKIRHLPLNFRSQGDGDEIIFLRLMTIRDDGSVIFTPTTLRYRPDADPPVEIDTTRSVQLHAWTWPDLRDVFLQAGFTGADAYGSYDGAPFDAHDSSDVIGVLVR